MTTAEINLVSERSCAMSALRTMPVRGSFVLTTLIFPFPPLAFVLTALLSLN
jgi:hypothetical protein